MGKKTTDLGTSQLMTYQQLLGMANEQMDDFATRMQGFLEEKKIGKHFYDTVVAELQPKLEANNKILSDIERVLFDRVKRDFASATLPNVMGRYFQKYREELASQAKINLDVKASIVGKEDSETKKVLKPNFNVEE